MSKESTATLVRSLDGFQGDVRLYKMSPPLEGYEYVAVSAASVFGAPETYIFGANESGDVTNWGELDGSYKGDLDHGVALTGAGYTVS